MTLPRQPFSLSSFCICISSSTGIFYYSLLLFPFLLYLYLILQSYWIMSGSRLLLSPRFRYYLFFSFCILVTLLTMFHFVLPLSSFTNYSQSLCRTYSQSLIYTRLRVSHIQMIPTILFLTYFFSYRLTNYIRSVLIHSPLSVPD